MFNVTSRALHEQTIDSNRILHTLIDNVEQQTQETKSQLLKLFALLVALESKQKELWNFSMFFCTLLNNFSFKAMHKKQRAIKSNAIII